MSRSHVHVRSAALAILSAGTLLGSVGCSKYRMFPTPGVPSLSASGVEDGNRALITTNTNLRAMKSDLGRLLLMDRPSRLSPQPMPY